MSLPLGIAIPALYVLIWIVVARLVAGHLAWDTAYGSPDTEDWMMGAFMGLILGMVWPIIVLGALIGKVPMIAVGAEREGRDRKREELMREQERRIRDLERELEIRA